MIFSIMEVNTKDIETLTAMSMIIYKALEQVLPIREVDYATFKRNTESRPFQLYIMANKEHERLSEMSSMAQVNKSIVNKGLALSYSTGMESSSNPRYGIIDIHQDEVNKTTYRIRLILSREVPVSQMDIMSAMIQYMEAYYIVRILSVEQHVNVMLEHYSKWESRVPTTIETGVRSENIIEKYVGIEEINRILKTMDVNIDVLMADRDLAEYEAALAAHKASLAFMEVAAKGSQEYYEVQEQIKDTEMRVAQTRQLMSNPILVKSLYFRIFDPRKLAKFAIRTIPLKKTHEVWS